MKKAAERCGLCGRRVGTVLNTKSMPKCKCYEIGEYSDYETWREAIAFCPNGTIMPGREESV